MRASCFYVTTHLRQWLDKQWWLHHRPLGTRAGAHVRTASAVSLEGLHTSVGELQKGLAEVDLFWFVLKINRRRIGAHRNKSGHSRKQGTQIGTNQKKIRQIGTNQGDPFLVTPNRGLHTSELVDIVAYLRRLWSCSSGGDSWLVVLWKIRKLGELRGSEALSFVALLVNWGLAMLSAITLWWPCKS